MPTPARPLAGVRALLLDLDGVIVLAEKPVEGSARAIGELARRGIPFRIVTNTSLVSRSTLSRWGASMGAPIPAERFQSALSVSAAYTARRFPGQPLYVLTSDDARTEFEGQRLLSDDEASKPDARAAAVVVGDSPEAATWDNLNRAFRLIRNGAELIGMHKNRWWLTPDGPTIDSGAFVAGLEFSAGVKARIVGKPAREFFTRGRERARRRGQVARRAAAPAARHPHGRRRPRDRRPGRPAGRPPRRVRADRQAHPRRTSRRRPGAAERRRTSSRIRWPTWSPR